MDATDEDPAGQSRSRTARAAGRTSPPKSANSSSTGPSPPGDRLPSSRALATELGVSRSVTRRRTSNDRRRMADTQQGAGTYVAAGGDRPRPAHRRPSPPAGARPDAPDLGTPWITRATGTAGGANGGKSRRVTPPTATRTHAAYPSPGRTLRQVGPHPGPRRRPGRNPPHVGNHRRPPTFPPPAAPRRGRHRRPGIPRRRGDVLTAGRDVVDLPPGARRSPCPAAPRPTSRLPTNIRSGP